MTPNQYGRAVLYLAFRALVEDRNKPPTLAECTLYEACFAYRDKQEKKQDG